MNTKSFSIFVYILSLTASFSYCQISRTGWQAELSTDFHDVSGTVTIVDDNTIQLNNFNYDGFCGVLIPYFKIKKRKNVKKHHAGQKANEFARGKEEKNDQPLPGALVDHPVNQGQQQQEKDFGPH